MERLDSFVTPLFVREIPESSGLNEALAEWLEAESRSRPSSERSIAGGWHSATDLTRREEPVVQAAVNLFSQQFEEVLNLMYAEAEQPLPPLAFRLTAWATVMQSGGYSMVHDHGDSHLSAVYWARAGETEGLSGWLELVDPRRASLELPELHALKSRVRVRPKSGMMVIFPGYLQHFVHPYRGTVARVSLAANAMVTRTPGPDVSGAGQSAAGGHDHQ